jgi:hypothetical protein
MNDLFPETLPDEIAKRLVVRPRIQFAHVDIRQDATGRYCLNDLHKAAGHLNKHRPSLWLANKRTKALIAELTARIPASNSCSSWQEFLPAPVATEATGNHSTYVVKPLVYAYAAWVSPAFDLLVCEVFDAVISAHVEQAGRESAALYAIRPRWKPIVAHPDMKRAALTELTGHKSPGSITACRRRMREVGLLEGSAA